MATIQEAIELVDGASATLRMIAGAADATSNSISETRLAFEKMENRMNGVRGTMGNVAASFRGMVAQFAMGNIAANAIMTIGEKLAELPGKMVAASDAYAGMQARLKLVAGSAQEAAAMNEQIFASAQRARGSYEGMLSNVAKIAMTAKEGFPDPKEVVPFVEGVQKLFAVGGTGVEEQKNAMLQLTQALGSGRLQGDEFRSIAEAAPLIEQMIAKEMGVTQGALKQLGSEGKITADVIKAAIFNNMDDINARFAQMPVTWASVSQNLGNVATLAFAPVYEEISRLANTQGMKDFINGLSNAIYVAGSAIAGVISGISTLGGMIYDGLGTAFTMLGSAIDYLATPLTTITAIFAGWITAVAVNNALLAIHNGLAAIHGAITGMAAAKTAIWTAATNLASLAQMKLNAVLMLNPIALVIGLVVAAIGIFIAWRGATIGLKNAVAEAFGAIARIVQNCVDGMIGCLNTLIGWLNKAGEGINKVFGTHIETIAEVNYTKGDWGKATEEAVKNFDVSAMLSASMPEVGAMNMTGFGGGGGETMDDIAESGKSTAGNTGRIADSMDLLDEDLQYLREVAEREAIDKYTTASVTVQLGGINNTINSDMDMDGFTTRLTEALYDGMMNAAQEVHV